MEEVLSGKMEVTDSRVSRSLGGLKLGSQERIQEIKGEGRLDQKRGFTIILHCLSNWRGPKY
jgi:hypothetical protein